MANKLIKSIAEKGLNYAKPRNQETASVQSQEPIIKVNLDGKITRINNTKQPIAKVGLDGKITAINRKEKKKKSGFFQGSKYFDNGYDFGDVTKTIFWSGEDLLQDVTRGFSRTIEGTTDTLGYLSADVLDFFGADDTADWLRDVSKYDVTEKLLKQGFAGELGKTSDYLEQRSVFGNYSDTVFEGVGNVGAMALTAGVTGGGTAATVFSSFSSAYGNTMSEALRNGADLNTARKTAIIHGTAEAISEQFFSGLPILKTENWGGKVVGKIGSGIERYFGTNTGKLAMKILNTTGEGFEEIISNMLTSAGNDLMHLIDKNFTYGMEGQSGNALKDMWKAATSKESWDSFISASLTSALTNGGNQFISNTQKNKLIKSYAQENNMTISQVKQAFNQSVQQKTQAEMQRQPNMNLGQRVETENMAKAQTMKELKRGTFVQPGTETDTYQYAKSENQKVNEMNQSMVDAGGNNTQANRELTATAKRLIEDLGFNIKFTNNEQIQNQIKNGEIKAVDGANINGYVKNGTMYLNLDSDELANFTIGHETKHFFEANKEMNDLLNQSLKEYAQLKGRYDEDLARVTKTYTDKNGNLIADPETELMADYVGEFFTDYNFVSNLSTKNPSLFARVRDFFQNLYYKATGQQEKILLKQINDNINKAYREYAKNKPDTNISSNEIQKVSQKEETKQEIKKKVKPKEETVLPIAEKVEEKQEIVKKQEKKVEIKEKPQVKQENRLTKEEQEELDGLQAAEEAFGNEGQDKVRYDYLMDKKNGNLKYPSLKSETTYQDIKNKYTKYKNNMEGFNSDLIQQAKDFVPGYRNTERRTKQQWLDVAEMIGKRANFKTDVELEKYAIQSWFKEQPNQKGNLNRQGEKFVKFTIEDWINSVYKGAGVGERIDNSIQYSLSETGSNQDNEGRTLSNEQVEYFKDSKATDGEGNLITVYHGSKKAGFTVFETPDGVSFYSDNPDVSATYSPSTEKVDTKKINSIEEAQEWLDNLGIADLSIEENKGQYNYQEKYVVVDNDIATNETRDIDDEIVAVYSNKEDLLRYLKRNIQTEYGNTEAGGMYEGYVNIKNPLVIDAKNNLWSEIPYNGIETTTNKIVDKALETNKSGKTNYDGVIFKNIIDQGMYFHKKFNDKASNVYVTFNSNQFKAVDNTNPTSNPDIRYSLSKNEDSYLDELSKEQMEYFKDTKAVDNLGYLDVVFHGTPEDFTVFDINKTNDVAFGNGLYFTTSEGNAESYSKSSENPEGKVLDGYVNIKKPASRTEKTISFEDFKNLYNELNNNPDLYDDEMGMSNINTLLSDYGNIYDEKIDNILRKFYDSYDNDVTLIDNLSYMDNAKEMYKTLRDVTGVDGIIVDNPTGFDDKETYYIIFNPDQFKLKSNKTPTINEDMRYSISQEGEDLESYYQDLYPIKSKVTTRLSDLKRKEVELPTEQENALKTSENEQNQSEKPTRREVIDRNRQLAREQLGDITQIKDKKRGLLYQINTMKRNLRDIMTKEQAQKMYDTYFKDITTNNAKIENDITSYNERIQKYNLNDKESTYTQMIGELKHNPETTLTKQQVDDFYNKNASKIDQQKCENAVNEFRQIYDELIEKVNDVLTDNGYKPIEYRKGYFPHFIEEKATSKLGKLAEKLGWKVKKGQLPTDIAGITDQFKPGKAWTSFSQQRTGDATDYNALKGLDNYLRGAMDVIYHTNDIQKLRALENEIRYQYSSKGVQDKINEIYADENLDMEEKNDAIANLTSNIRESGLGNFVTEIRNYTDNLANKKAFGDRSMEQTLGRDVYSIMNNINGRVSANMVGANISSAITNFIPITQAWSQLSTKNLMRGMYESIKTSIKGDNFADRSTFLTNRTKQAERLYNTKMDKLTQKLGVPFEAIDSFTSNTIVRAKYYDNIAKGMSEQEAMSNADEFAKDVMAGRSKGDQPTIFNRKNPLFKLFTAFQLEVNNQYGYMFKDIPTNMADEAKRKLVGAFIKMFLGAWLYNEITEKFTGRRAAFDPIDMAVSDVKTLTNEDMDLGDKIQSIVKDTAQEVPFVSGLAGGGRLPIQGAIPYSNPLEMVTKTFEDIGKLDDPEKRKTAINNLKKEWSKPVYYLLFPVAGGQVKKTVEGLSMYDKDLPIAGSYTNSGKLRFEADTSTLGKVQAAVFGQYASKNAREYFKNGYTPLTEGQVEEALEAELPINEYREINQGIKDAKAEAKAKGENQTEAMYDYIYDLPIEMEQKNSLINSRTKGSTTIKDDNGYIKYVDDKGKTYWYDKKNDVVYNSKYKEMNTKDIADLTKASTQKDISNYGNYGSLAEFNYSNKNPEKYLALTKIADYDTFMEYKDELAAIKQRYDNKPTEFKKKKVFEYINSLPLSVEQKLMLQKMGAGYSIKQYRGRLHNYINSMELTKEQKQAIDKVLFD